MKLEEIIKMLPEGYKEACWEMKAMSRKRGIQNADDLLKLSLFYVYDHSLKETAGYAEAAGIYKISDVGFMKRFKRCNEWFKWINANILPAEITAYQKPEKLNKYQVIAVDASDIVGGGKANNTWHLHYAVDIFSLSCAEFVVTEEKTGETLKNFELLPDDLVLGDRAYATITGIEYCRKCNADFILRIKNNPFNIYDKNGEKICFTEFLKDVKNACQDFTIYYIDSEKQLQPLRLCAVKKDAAAIKNTEKKLRRKESRKRVTVSDDTKFASQYFFVITSLDQSFSAKEILDLYKLRWQVEMVFKRFKSILHLGNMPTKDCDSCEAWLNCKMMIALLTERLISSVDFSPCGEFNEEYLEGNEDCLFIDFSQLI